MGTETIDLTPTWEGILPGLIAALRYGTAEGQQIAEEELTKLARFADAVNAERKATAS